MEDWIFSSIFDCLDDIRSSLDSASSKYTSLVILGVICEILFIYMDHRDDWQDWKDAQTRSIIPIPKRPGRTKLMLEMASVGLVVWGLWGELHTSNKIESLDTLTRDVNEYRALLLEYEAGSAASSAERAGKAAAAARADAEALEKDLAWRGPRQVLINGSGDLFKKHLAKFKDQKVVVLFCWGQYSLGDQEVGLTSDVLRRVLKEKAGWNVLKIFKIPADQTCGTIGEGISVSRSDNAPSKTRDAAQYLLATIDKALSQGMPVIEEKEGSFAVNGVPIGSDVIKVVVRMHPMRQSGPTNEDKKLLTEKAK